jgi:predicted RNase H-like nuclease
LDIYIGFDSAWTDNPRAPGAITALSVPDDGPAEFQPPRLVSFEQALRFIRSVQSNSGVTLVAIDQPTIVPNGTSMRPVERAAASLVSWMGGGVQPANRGRRGMFCDASPIWRFLHELAAVDDPEGARAARSGLHIIEVFPALALPSLDLRFFGRLKAPRYNPARRKTFRLDDWRTVAKAAERRFSIFGLRGPAAWCREAADLPSPRKADQDCLDAMLCLCIFIGGLHIDRRPSCSGT